MSITSPKNLSICTSPQHLMNLAQAHLSGIVSGPVRCLILEHAEPGRSHGNSVLRGTVAAVGRLCPALSMKIYVLRSPVANLRIAQLARGTHIDARGTLLLGIYPSPLWARSPAMESARQVVLLDDGASSLNLDLSRVFEGRIASGRSQFLTRAVETATGSVRRPQSSPIVYTCFPVGLDGVPVLQHQYAELRTALRATELSERTELPGTRVWVDSNYSWLSPRTHLDLVKGAVQQFGIDTYVPHRRTERPRVAAISRELGLTVFRPDLPLELLIGKWTHQGATLFTPPTSLVHTASPFLEAPGKMFVVETSAWLKIRTDSALAQEVDGLAVAFNHASLIEQSIDPSGPFHIVSLR